MVTGREARLAPGLHSRRGFLQQEGKFARFRQGQQNRQLFLQGRSVAGGLLRRQDEQPEQRLRRKARLFQIPQVDPAVGTVQELHVRPEFRSLQLPAQQRQTGGPVPHKMAAAKGALVQPLQQIAGLQSRVPFTLVQQIFHCPFLHIHSAIIPFSPASGQPFSGKITGFRHRSSHFFHFPMCSTDSDSI